MPDGSPWPRISIVTPSYNQGQFIEETIRSVLLQGYPDFEYFIIDGGSTDNSLETINRYSPWIRRWVSKPDRGQADAINKGFGWAHGALMAFINSDDYYAPDILHDVAHLYRKELSPKFFWALYPVENIGDCATFTNLPERDFTLASWISKQAYIHQPGVFWSKPLIAEMGPLDTSLRYAFDRKLFMCIIARGIKPEVRSQRLAAYFRFHSASKTTLYCGPFSPDNRFDDEFQLLSLEFSRHLPKDQGARVAGENIQLLLDTCQNRMAQVKSYGKKLRIALQLARVCPACMHSRFFWGMLCAVPARSADRLVK